MNKDLYLTSCLASPPHFKNLPLSHCFTILFCFVLFLVLDSVFHSIRFYLQGAGMTFKCKIKRAKQKTQSREAAGGAELLALLW